MKIILKILTLFGCLMTVDIQAQNIQLIMSPNPSPYISDWSSRTETVTLIITNTSTEDIQVKLKTQIFDGKGSLIVDTDIGKMPSLTVPPGVNRYNPEDIIPGNAVSYKGTMAMATLKTGKIPEDNYKICLSLLDPKSGAPVGTSGTVCKFFNIVSYQAPVLIHPTDKQTLTESDIRGLMFRWSPVTPTPKTIVTYRLQVWEVLEGQDPMTALRSNRPIVEKDYKAILQTQWPIEFPLPEAGRRYVWTVTPLDDEERKLVDGIGFAQPFAFSVSSGGGLIDIKLAKPPMDKVFNSGESNTIEFEWTNVQGILSYNIKIYELKPGEDAGQLMRAPGTRIPITDANIDAYKYSWPVPDGSARSKEGRRFAWIVQALDKEGKGIVGAEFEEPGVFMLAASNINTEIDSLQVSCCLNGKQNISISVGNIVGNGNQVKVTSIKYSINGSSTTTILTSITPALGSIINDGNSQIYTASIGCIDTLKIIKFIVTSQWPNDADVVETEVARDTLNCRCNDCDSLTLNFDDLEITPVAGNSGQYTLSGNINVNRPVFGFEFQLQSYGYSATPAACANGVTQIAQSGMFQASGSTINGNAIQIFNETASGSSSTDNTISKIIKMTSTTEMSGDVPINLILGLPGSITGLDASCCEIKYNVCLKVRVYLEPDSCKSCSYRKCFAFNNQVSQN